MAARADNRLGDTEHGSVREELEAAYRGDGDSGGGGGGESKVRQPPISDSGEGGGGGESKAEGAFDPVEMLQTIRRENAQLASHGEAGPATWETLYGNMKTLYEYEKTQNPKFYKRMIRQKCLGPKIKILEWNKSYKALTGCYIFRDVDRDTILGPNAEYNLGYLFPAVLSGPQGRQWVQGGQTEVDDRYNHEGDERSAWDEIAEFERDNKVVAWSPAHRDNPEVLPHFWYRQGHKLRYGVYLPGARHPTLNTPYGGHLEAVGGVPATPIRRTPAPLATSVKLIEEGERSDSIPYLSSEGVYASAIDDDVPNPDEMGGGRKRRKKTRRKKKRKTKRLRRKKRKTKRRRKKKRTRRKR